MGINRVVKIKIMNKKKGIYNSLFKIIHLGVPHLLHKSELDLVP